MARFLVSKGVRRDACNHRAARRVGSQLRAPTSRSLGKCLFELRLNVDRAPWRITFYFADRQRIVLLTVFRKQKQTERAEVRRARQAMRRCIAEGHTAEEDD